MTKAAALYKFWSGFGLPAYEESAVPTGDDAPDFPYITYEVSAGSFETDIPLAASVWYRSTSWRECDAKAQQISDAIGYGGAVLPCDGGYIWIQRGTPFSSNMGDESDNAIRRNALNITAQFFTEN